MQKSRGGRRIPLYLFLGVMLFALAQSVWWMVYQLGESNRLRDQELAVYEERQRSLTLELQRIGRPINQMERRHILEYYPGMALRETDEGVTGLAPVISSTVQEKSWDDARGRARMFLAEGGFFTLLLVFGIWLQLAAYRRLEDTLRQQSNFISAVTHELKSPLTSISLFAELLEKPDLDPQARMTAASSIREESARLTGLVEQILRVRTLDARDLRLDRLPVELGALVERQMGELEHRAGARGISLVSRIQQGDSLVLGDSEALGLLVGNLIDNAIKYSADNSQIEIGVERSGSLVQCWVQDQGQGFEPHESRRLFDRFYRAGDELTRKTTGTGLGLYLVREFAEAMDGRVRADSDGPGTGARFTVTLPLLKGKEA